MIIEIDTEKLDLFEMMMVSSIAYEQKMGEEGSVEIRQANKKRPVGRPKKVATK